ncbi:hypothetical protein Acr_00g0045120 [Actinidia rufa]|uniref:Uncharacterized protein n=1 Tax=Actinidia rufa TaxID=165716 RepID=A0A7J0DKJ4_9ERIC|nr:hypothetical protein Acr_00g0045120 [Actinidia rufa]
MDEVNYLARPSVEKINVRLRILSDSYIHSTTSIWHLPDSLPTSTGSPSKVIIKKVIKPGVWGFDLSTAKIAKLDYELMKKCMYFFKDQFSSSFCKDYCSIGSDLEKDTEEGVLAGEGQNPDEDNEDMHSEDMEYQELTEFYHYLKDDKRRRPKHRP